MSSKEELIGFHKGSLNTLMKEYNELGKMLNIVGNFIGYHKQELEKLGVKIEINNNQTPKKQEQTKQEPTGQKSNMDYYSKLDNL